MKLEQIYKALAYFKCILQQYSLFSIVPVYTQNPKDIDEPEFLVLSSDSHLPTSNTKTERGLEKNMSEPLYRMSYNPSENSVHH